MDLFPSCCVGPSSGTTGKPKGCILEHRNLLFCAEGHKPFCSGDGISKSLAFANYVFDASVNEIFSSLLYGHTVVLASEDLRKNILQVGDLIVERQIDWAFLTPQMAQVIDASKLAQLKKLAVAGEAPSLPLLEKLSEVTSVYNLIGPSECGVICSGHLFQKGDLASNIGKPVANCLVYVLNEQLQPVPIGAPGELYIGGKGVGRGYLKREQLNEEKFMPNPFAEGRMYKSGMSTPVPCCTPLPLPATALFVNLVSSPTFHFLR